MSTKNLWYLETTTIKMVAQDYFIPFFPGFPSNRNARKVTLLVASPEALLEVLPSIGTVFLYNENTNLVTQVAKKLPLVSKGSKEAKLQGDEVIALALRLKTASRSNESSLEGICDLYYEYSNELPYAKIKSLFPCSYSSIITVHREEDGVLLNKTPILDNCVNCIGHFQGKCFLGCNECLVRTREIEECFRGLLDVPL